MTAADQQQGKQLYLFRLDTSFIIDATEKGGLARYINHSCEPNCTSYKLAGVARREGQRRVVVIIAKVNLARGTEITYDYGIGGEEDSEEGEHDEMMVRCRCGSKRCRGWL